MDAKTFIEDEGAATPVIGIILVVVITIVLAAVIGTFVLDTGKKRTTTAPQVSFSFEYDEGVPELVATHESGAAIENPGARLSVKGDASPSIDSIDDEGDGELNSGDTIVISLGSQLADGDTIQIVWSDANTDTTSVVARYEFGA